MFRNKKHEVLYCNLIYYLIKVKNFNNKIRTLKNKIKKKLS